MPQLTPGKQL